VRALAGDLAGLGSSGVGARVAVDALDVDLAVAPLRSRSASAARHASCTAPAAIHVMREADAEPASRRSPSAPARATTSACRAPCAPPAGSRGDALPDLGGGAVDLGDAVAQHDARGAESSKPSE
jgi:hypothetical protein